jgi:hypothetical protein
MVELRTIRVPGMDGALQASRTVAQIAGMTFVAVQNGDGDPVIVGQSLVALQSIVAVMNSLP